MSRTTVRSNDMKFEIVVIPVSNVDRAKEFYETLGWRLDAEFAGGEDFRVIQFTRIQEITTRLAGRIDSGVTSFASANGLAEAFRRAEAAHAKYETRIGQGRDANWPD